MKEFGYTSQEIDELDAADYDMICVLLPAIQESEFYMQKAAVNQGMWGGKK